MCVTDSFYGLIIKSALCVSNNSKVVGGWDKKGHVCSAVGDVRLLATLLGGCGVGGLILSPKNDSVPVVRSLRGSSFFRYRSIISREDTICCNVKLTRRAGSPITYVYASNATMDGCLPNVARTFCRSIPVITVATSGSPCELGRLVLRGARRIGVFRSIAGGSIGLPIIHNKGSE